MGRLNLTAPLGLSLAAALPMVAFADVGVPSAARMIHSAGVIVVGSVTGGSTPGLALAKVLKGSTAGHRTVSLADPSGGRFLTFNLGRVPEIVGAGPTVALGNFDGSRATLTLTWLNASFWPQGHRHDTYDSSTLESTVAFIERVLGYSALAARDPDAALRKLVSDTTSGQAQAVLAYLEVAVQADFGPLAAAQIRAVCAAALGRITPDAASTRQFADIAQVFPVTLAAPLALKLADSAGDDAERLRNAVQAMLNARGGQLAAKAGSSALRTAYGQQATALRRADARRLLPVYDSTVTSLRDTYADALMAELLGTRPPEPLAGLSAAQRKAIWRREIDAMPD